MRQMALCWCSLRVINIRNATWVEEIHQESRPFCQNACHERFLQKEADRLEGEVRRAEMRAIENRDFL